LKLPSVDIRYPLTISACLMAVCGALLIVDGWREAHSAAWGRPRLHDYSEAALQREIASFDPAMAALARRFDPLSGDRRFSRLAGLTPSDVAEQLTVDDLAPMTPAEAFRLNAATPISTEPNPAARPFLLDTAPPAGARALDCLTAAVYYEAAYERPAGQAAVAQVVLNRVRHPAYPKSICGVVLQGADRRTGCQFTFTCDGALSHTPNPEVWARARAVAAAALAGRVEKSVGNATHYHTVWVRPYWATSLTKVQVIGAHVFYRWNGGWGLARAFRGEYAGEADQYAGLRALYAALQPLGLQNTASGAEEAALASAAASPPVLTLVDAPSPAGDVIKASLKTVDAAPAAPPPPPKLIHISGEVEKPGDYPWREGMTLADAAAAAGGFTYRARNKEVLLRRAGAAEAKVDGKTLTLQPDDQVKVPERHF